MSPTLADPPRTSQEAGALAVVKHERPEWNPPPNLHQAPKVRAAPVVKVCPSSVEQRARWVARAAERGMSLSAWLAQAADEKIARG